MIKFLPALVLIWLKNFICLKMNAPVDIVYTLDWNEWNGEKMIQFKIIDFALSTDAAAK